MASENPDLITRWINAGTKRLADVKGFTARQLQKIQKSITLGWQSFQKAFPTFTKALKGIGRITSAPFRKLHTFYKNHQVTIAKSAKAGLVLFFVGW